MTQIKLGDRVTYADVNLRDFHGVVEAKDGEWIGVRWESPNRDIHNREWARNLIVEVK